MMNDTYLHLDSNIMYIEENIPGPLVDTKECKELFDAYNSQITSFCICDGICSKKCTCIKKSRGQNYVAIDRIGNIKNLKFILNYENKDFNKYSIIECNVLCKCSPKCGNRVVQYGPKDGLFVKSCETELKGLGLYTKTMTYIGTFICEYAGELITKTEAMARQHRNKIEGKMNFIYCLTEHSNDKVIQTFVDPTYYANIGRYINHSCEPNCILIPTRVNSPIPKLAIFSRTYIMPNTELTIDYGSYNLASRTMEPITQEQDQVTEEEDRIECLCNAASCRHWIPFDKY